MNVANIPIVDVFVRKMIYIKLPAYEGNITDFRSEVIQELGINNDILQGLDSNNFAEMLNQEVTVTLAMPPDFGYNHAIMPDTTVEIAKKHGLRHCVESVPLRIALAFDEIGRQLPTEYLRHSWWIYMWPIPITTGLSQAAVTGNYEIVPSNKYRLFIEWRYTGSRSGISRDQPILFQCP